MPDWSTGRTEPLPPYWGRIRRLILLRDLHRCQWGSVPDDGATYGQCSVPATEVDHIDGSGDHSPGNLRALCTPHHARRSSQQGAAASNSARRRLRELRNRPREQHPGVIYDDEENSNDHNSVNQPGWQDQYQASQGDEQE